MQAINGIQNAMINTNAGANAALVVDAANAHRTYLRDERTCDPVPMRPDFGVMCSMSNSTSTSDLKQRSETGTNGTDVGNGPGTLCTCKTWRFDNRHLPGAAWAMLVLNRSLCG